MLNVRLQNIEESPQDDAKQLATWQRVEYFCMLLDKIWEKEGTDDTEQQSGR